MPLQPPPHPPAQVAILPGPELPLLPGSDPMILAAYRWTLAHSPSLQEVVRQLARADRKARFRLLPGLDNRFAFEIFPTEDAYEIDIRVPFQGWSRCGDALEPWIASSLYLALEVVTKERYRTSPWVASDYAFLEGSIHGSFLFQRKVRGELQAADPERLKDLPDGPTLYKHGFIPSGRGPLPQRRALPADPPAQAERAPAQP